MGRAQIHHNGLQPMLGLLGLKAQCGMLPGNGGMIQHHVILRQAPKHSHHLHQAAQQHTERTDGIRMLTAGKGMNYAFATCG
jgi:hypothetical protein